MTVKEKKPGRALLERIFKDNGFDEFKWINPDDIVVAEWVRMKCMFGCGEYGRRACCPPATPPVEECERFFKEYSRAAVFHFACSVKEPEDRHAWTLKINENLTALERRIFLANYPKAFVLHIDSCSLCKKCSGKRDKCINPKLVRPGPEAMAVDVFGTVSKLGFPICVLDDYDKVMNRYAFLMIE